MKKDILKIAGVKSEAELYAKYGTEAEFMAKHGGAFKKAKMGSAMVKKQLIQLTDFANPPQAQDGVDVPQYQYAGMPLKANLQTPSFMQPFNFNAPAYQQYQPMGLPDSRSEDIVNSSVYDITGMDRYYGKPLTPKSPKPFVSKVPPKENKLTKDNIFDAGLDIVQGIVQSKEDRENMLRAKQFSAMSDVALQAASVRDDIKNRYLRPEDMMFDPNQLSRSYGTGYDVLQATAEDGTKIGGNPTEIQNMYNPGDIYSNLGYEPLDESSKVKQFQGGGAIFANWKQDLTSFGADSAGDLGGGLGSYIGGGKGEASGASKIGGGLGQLAGTALGGPLGGVIGSAAGSLLGGVIGGAQQKKIDDMLAQGQANAANASFQQLQQGRFSSFMEDGGEVGLKYLSHDWQPQVIATFGEHKLKDLLRPDNQSDIMRSGGHLKDYSYTPPSARAMSTERPNMQMGGNLKPLWGGDIEPVSYNPYMPGDGMTYEAFGDYHKDGGVGMDYAGSKVEVQPKEPIFETEDGGSIGPDGQPEKSATVLGGMRIDKTFAPELGEEISKGLTFQKYGQNLSKLEVKQNKIMDKGVSLVDEINGDNPFDLLKLNSGKALMAGANMKLKGIADKKITAANIQQSIHEEAEKYGYKDVDKFNEDLFKGKFKGSKMAKFGAKMETAQGGLRLYGDPVEQSTFGPGGGYQAPLPPATVSKGVPGKRNAVEVTDISQVTDNDLRELYTKAEKYKGKGANKAVADFQRAFHAKYPEVATQILSEYDVTNLGKTKGLGKSNLESNVDQYFGPRTERYRAALENIGRKPMLEKPTRLNSELPPAIVPPKTISPKTPTMQTSTPPLKGPGVLDVAYSLLEPYTRRGYKVTPDLSSEMFALASNQLDPVQAQTFKPLLETPQTVSYQDILNANQADFNALQRRVGYNPAALSELSSKKYAANAAAKAQEFRENQGLAMGAYNRNRSLLNDSTLKNLAILDTQYQRQSQARSNTKAQAQAALNSISDKIAKSKLESMTMNVYQNMFPQFTFDSSGRAIKTGAPTRFNIGQVAKKGAKVNRNGSIVKAIKNL
jgi:hypothetical protein